MVTTLVMEMVRSLPLEVEVQGHQGGQEILQEQATAVWAPRAPSPAACSGMRVAGVALSTTTGAKTFLRDSVDKEAAALELCQTMPAPLLEGAQRCTAAVGEVLHATGAVGAHLQLGAQGSKE